jgi:DNA polymerase-3 subunit delta'
MVTDGRIGEALMMDLADQRERQRECLNVVAPKTLRSPGAVLSIAETLAKAERGPEILSWLNRWIRDLILVHVGGDCDQILHTERLDQLEAYAGQANLDALLDLLGEIQRIEQGATRHLNMHMALESCLFRLRDALSLAPAGTPA